MTTRPTPDEDDRDYFRTVLSAATEGLIRVGVAIILWRLGGKGI